MYSNREAGMLALQRGDYAGAIAHLEEAARQDGSDVRVFLALGAAYGERKQFAEAVGALDRAVELQPNAASVHYNLAIALERTEQLHEAIASLERSIQLQPDYARATEALNRLRPAIAAPPSPPAGGPLPGFAAPTAGSPDGWPVPPGVGAQTGFLLGDEPPQGDGPRLDPTLAFLAQEHAQRHGNAAPPPPPLTRGFAPPTPPEPPTPSAYGGSGSSYGTGGTCVGPTFALPQPAAGPHSGAHGPTAPSPYASPSRGSSGVIIGIILAVVIGGLVVVGILGAILYPRLQKAVEQTTFQASDTRGGLVVSDPAGVSMTLPAGFPPARTTPQDRSAGGMDLKQNVHVSSKFREQCALIVGVFPNEIFSALPANRFMNLLMEQSFGRAGATISSTRPAPYQGQDGQEARIVRTEGGRAVHARVRIVLTAPRLIIQGFESRDEKNLMSPAVNAYFDSLRIASLPPQMQPAPLNRGFSPGQFPQGLGPPMGSPFGAPTTPGMSPSPFGSGPGTSPPRMGSPETPQPPSFPRSSGMPPGGMSPGAPMGPGGPPSSPYGQGGPPPGFPGGSGGSFPSPPEMPGGGPPFGPGGGGPPFGPGAPPFGPGGSGGGPPFGPGGPPGFPR